MNRTDGLRDIVKSSGGLEAFSKSLAVDPSIGASISEAEFTALCQEEARKAHPTESAAQAFAKYFGDPENITIRQAHQIINAARPMSYLKSEPLEKAAPLATLEPRVSGGRDAQDVDNATDAMAKLNALKAQLRRAQPHLSDAEAFALVYQDPNNSQLAEAERRANRPSVG